MVRRRRLRKPHVARIAGDVAGFERAHHGVGFDQRPARGVDQVGAALHLGEHLVVEEVPRRWIERHLQVDDIDAAHQRVRVGVEGQAQLLLDLRAQPVRIGIVQVQVEGLQPAQHRQADPACGDRAEMHAFDVVAALDAIGDIPPAVHRDLVRRQVVADQRQHHHHHMLGDADAVGAGHFGHGDMGAGGRFEIDVIGADAGGERQLQLLRLRDPLLGQVGGPERLRDHHFGVRQMLLEHRLRAVLVAGHDQLVAVTFQITAQTQFARDATHQLARLEAERPLRRRRGLAVGVAGDGRNVVPRIFRRIASFGVGIAMGCVSLTLPPPHVAWPPGHRTVLRRVGAVQSFDRT